MAANILLLDDDPLVLKSLSGFFQSRGYTMCSCRSGSEAVRAFEEQPIDLIVTDIRMQGIDGIEFLQQVRAIEKHRNIPQTPVIIMTAYADSEAQKAASELSVRDYFSKPFDISDLISSVEKCVADLKTRA